MPETIEGTTRAFEPATLLSGAPEVRQLNRTVERLLNIDTETLTKSELLELMRDVEAISRRLDATKNHLLDGCDASGAYAVDGHRSAKPCIKHLGRLSGSEAHGRVQTTRQLRGLPAVSSAYEAGLIPTEIVRAICRIAANPRVYEFLQFADPVFAEMACELRYDAFMDWIRRWEQLADADGAGEAAETSHERRDARAWTNPFDGTTTITSNHAGAQGAFLADVLEKFTAAEFEVDLAWAKENLGDDFSLDQLPRTPAQRRADALLNIFRRAVAQPADARSPEPLVSIVVDQETFEDEILRQTEEPWKHGGKRSGRRDPDRVDDVVCHTTSGVPLHPSDALAAALIGHVRRVVIDRHGRVIDLGRKRRLFTDGARDAALLQDLIASKASAGCRWPECDTPHHKIQIDHRQSWGRDGPTSPANSQTLCGPHNRLKETGYTPVRAPDGTWTVRRPDQSHIIPPA